MDEDKTTDAKSKGSFDAALPLPTDDQSGQLNQPQGDSSNDAKSKDQSLAAEVIRKKVEAAYGHEPALAKEIKELEAKPKSKHQEFVYKLTNSGKSLADMQAEWHQYYAELPDDQKHQVWQEFYENQALSSKYAHLASGQRAHEVSDLWAHRNKLNKLRIDKKLDGIKHHVQKHVSRRSRHTARSFKTKKPIHSLLFGLSAGLIAVAILMFGFFNERFIAPFIQPSRNAANTPLITEVAVGPEPEIIIPKINVEIPVVYNVTSVDEATVLKALEEGVVNFGDSARPGQNGNVVIVGHSSNNIFNKGKYKFAFVLLNRLAIGDTFYLQKDGQRYTYQVYQRSIVEPTDVSVLGTKDKPATATLITCDPPGTALKRLVVVGEQISPNPTANAPQTTDNTAATQTKVVPGNAKSLWSRMWSWLGD